tara:strand:- start:90 stop:527 length:438 start_codon:yes stop_codon:yes gene_type:complete
MPSYVVKHISNTKTYKSSTIETCTVYVGTNINDATVASVNCWLELWLDRAQEDVERGLLPSMGDELLELLTGAEEKLSFDELVKINDFFSTFSDIIWDGDASELVTIDVERKNVNGRVSIDEHLLDLIKELCGFVPGEDYDEDSE